MRTTVLKQLKMEHYLRNRSALAVNCCVKIHCLEVSCKEDQITSTQRDMEGKKRHYSMHTSLFLYVANFILFCKLCHYIMQIVI